MEARDRTSEDKNIDLFYVKKNKRKAIWIFVYSIKPEMESTELKRHGAEERICSLS
jgi:hypothetical protein